MGRTWRGACSVSASSAATTLTVPAASPGGESTAQNRRAASWLPGSVVPTSARSRRYRANASATGWIIATSSWAAMPSLPGRGTVAARVAGTTTSSASDREHTVRSHRDPGTGLLSVGRAACPVPARGSRCLRLAVAEGLRRVPRTDGTRDRDFYAGHQSTGRPGRSSTGTGRRRSARHHCLLGAKRDDGSVGIGPCTVGTHATRLLLVGRPIVARAEVDLTAMAGSENDRHTTIPTNTRVGLVAVTTGETHYHLPAAACRRGGRCRSRVASRAAAGSDRLFVVGMVGGGRQHRGLRDR